LIADITAQLTIFDAIFDANAETATGGNREAAKHVRDAKLTLATTTLSQVCFYYCSASRDTDQTPELSKINSQPRRDPGTINNNPRKPPPAAPTANE
jgi:hypothetical protein